MLENISAFDGIALGVVVISAIMAFARGFLRELATLGAFIGALAAAYYARKFLHDWVAGLMPEGSHALAPDIILVVTAFLIVYTLVAWLGQSLSRSIMTNGDIGLFDHIAGLVFGIIRGGVALVFFAVLLSVGLEDERVPPFILESVSYPILAQAADSVTGEAREAGQNAQKPKDATPASGD
jgi:membrane protein required for colicin V production